tara:strand:+ start:208 stop:585 length:378 start_codon:yes stop_codon:yes gene_type:complete
MYGEKMGIRSRVKKALQKIRVLGQIIHEESKYPGRPQPHVVAKNPLWGGGDARDGESKDTRGKEETTSAENPVNKDTSISQQKEGAENNEQGSLNEEGADYWFLQYDDVEGWNESNPGQKKSDEK